jgi:hypothetical protein
MSSIHGARPCPARIYARQTDTNVTAETTTDEGGRFLAYLKVGP